MKGVRISKYYLEGDLEFLDEHWAKHKMQMIFSAKTYINNMIPISENLFCKVLKLFNTPMDINYYPKEDQTPLLDIYGKAR